MNRPVVIAAFRSPDEAARAKRALEREGIAAQAGPRTDAFERMCADAFDSGFDVIVDADEAVRGIAIVQRLWPDDARGAEHGPRCPACGSVDVMRIPRLLLFAIAAAVLITASMIFGQRDLFLLVIGIIGGLLVLMPKFRCRTCGERFSAR